MLFLITQKKTEEEVRELADTVEMASLDKEVRRVSGVWEERIGGVGSEECMDGIYSDLRT